MKVFYFEYCENFREISLTPLLGSSTTAEEILSSLETLLTVLYSHKGGEEQVLSVWRVEDLVQDRIYLEIILLSSTRPGSRSK